MVIDPPKARKKSTPKRAAKAKPPAKDRSKVGGSVEPSLKGRTSGLSDIRRFLEVRKEIAALIGQLATFRIVVDANIFIRELLWIITKRKNQSARPALLECLEDKTIIAHVTPRILEEVERTMKSLAVERGFSNQAWQPSWNVYLSMLIVLEPDPSVTARYEAGRDSTDAPTLALAETPGIDGILSGDADIKAMGGKVLPLTFKLEARDYSRKAAIQVSLQIGGFYFAAGAVEGLLLLAKSLGNAIRGIGRLPSWLKLLLAGASLCLAAHPATRKEIQNVLASTRRALTEATPELIALVVWLYQEFERVKAEPPVIQYV